MNILHQSYSIRLHNSRAAIGASTRRFFAISSSLPFPDQKAKYHAELQAAVCVVERACHLCVDVNKSLLSNDGQILEKTDQTPVTVADFSVQALISLELGELFPSIPLVAEEDSAFLRSNNLVNSVVSVVTHNATSRDTPLTNRDVLEAIDRGGKDAFRFGPNPATYWILDPIDGTRGFLKGSEALYVVGLALVVEGEIVLGVMGCPNWQNENYTSGIIMVSHVGCGTWRKSLKNKSVAETWTTCFVDSCSVVHKARFCNPDSQTWDSLPLSQLFDATTDAENITDDKTILLLPACCGSLCKYLMVASGRATVFIQRSRAHKVIKVWDHAVGIICIQEAGGKVSDWKGNKIDLAEDKTERRILYPSGGVLATNDTLHNEIINIISST